MKEEERLKLESPITKLPMYPNLPIPNLTNTYPITHYKMAAH